MYAATVGFALELELSALERALGFVTPVTAVVDSVADSHARRTISVCTLEHAGSTVPGWTTRRLVGTVFAILLSVASTVQFLSHDPTFLDSLNKRDRNLSIFKYLTSNTRGYTFRRVVRSDADPRCSSLCTSCRPYLG